MNSIELLRAISTIRSYSGEEDEVVNFLLTHLNTKGVHARRVGNNFWIKNKCFDEAKPTILLNSHTDTVRPNAEWVFDPFAGTIAYDKLIGLGVNDAGASLICLMQVFLNFYEENLPFNLIFCASAEEEISGKNGIDLVINELGNIAFAIVGEPTNCEIAVAEKGLLVIDAVANGVAGHAARNTGKNAIYVALNDIAKLKSHRFSKHSELLGEVHLNVTQIEAGSQHNVIPASCSFTIDIRLTDKYTHENVLEELQAVCESTLTARSMRLKSSGLALTHPIFKIANNLGIRCYGSPTMSDQALMPWPSIKTGPGRSERSHTADEFIFLHEIEQGIQHYTTLLNALKNETLG